MHFLTNYSIPTTFSAIFATFHPHFPPHFLLAGYRLSDDVAEPPAVGDG